MNWNFTANSPDELANIDHKLLNAAKQTFLDEQWQMSQLLKAMSSASIFEFPVRVRHTGVRGVPDFQIESGGRRIAIELAKITAQDVEHARGLQRKGLKRTLGICIQFTCDVNTAQALGRRTHWYLRIREKIGVGSQKWH